MNNRSILEKIDNSLFNIFSFLFIFNMINRGFEPFGFDIRFINVFVGLGAIFVRQLVKVIKKVNYDRIQFTDKLLIIIYAFGLVSAIPFMLYSNVYISKLRSETISLVIIYAYLLIALLVFISNSKKMTLDKVCNYFSIAFIFNLASMIYIHFSFMGGNMNPSIYSKHQSLYRGTHYNFFGQNLRVAGYSVDPNYVSINTLAFVLLKYLKSGKRSIISFAKSNLLVLIIAIYSLMLSASKTVLLMVVAMSLLLLLYRRNTKKIPISSLILVGLLAALFVPILFGDFFKSDTMVSRITLWNRAFEFWIQSPIVGNGLSSFRHFVGAKNWVVHAHSTLFQILSEQGIIVFVMWIIIMIRNANYFKNKSSFSFLVYTVFSVWSLTYETVYLPQFIFFNLILFHVINNEAVQSLRIMNVTNGLATGGAEKVALDIAGGMGKMGFDSTLLITDPTKITVYENRMESEDFKLIDISDKKHDLIGNNVKVYKILKLNDFDVIHTHQITLMYMVWSLIFISGITWVHTVHSDAQKEFGSKVFRIFYHVLFWLFSIEIVVISDYVLKGAVKEYFLVPKSRFEKIYNGVTLPKVPDVVDTVDNELINIICVGRLTEVKNYDLVLDASVKMNELKINHNISIYGEGELHDHLAHRINTEGIQESVCLCGVTSNIHEAMSNKDVFLMTSNFEGLGLAAIEAMSHGLPLILTNFGPANELVDVGQNGYIVDSDAESVVEAILKVRSMNKVDLAESSILKSKNFAKDIMIEKYSSVYKK